MAFNQAVVHHFLLSGVLVDAEDGLTVLIQHKGAVSDVPNTEAFGNSKFTFDGQAVGGDGACSNAFQTAKSEHGVVAAIAGVLDPHADGLLTVGR